MNSLPIPPMELWAFLENSDFERFQQGSLYRQDEVALIHHDVRLEEDYALMNSIGCKGIRDAARWYLTHPAPHTFDWTWLDRVVQAAADANLVLYLDLWHYGYPTWMDIFAADAVDHFAEFAREIAKRYPSLVYYCVSNEPSLMVEFAGRLGRWRPFLRGNQNAKRLRQRICEMIIAASKAILEVNPDAQLVLPEPWHASKRTFDEQAQIVDTVLGRCNPHLGGEERLVTVVGLNHYRDTTLPPLHQLIVKAQTHWSGKPLWLTETSGPPRGWLQAEWFWWMMAEVNLARLMGVAVPVFTWAPAISMFDWVDETRQLTNGIWKLDRHYNRQPHGNMVESIALARSYGYLK